MTQQIQTRAARCADEIQVLPVNGELDLATAGSLAARGCAAIAGHTRLLLLDLTCLTFCDARGVSALVRIANHADTTGCRYGLIAPQPPVAKLLRITRLDQRMPVFITVGDALARLTASPGTCAVYEVPRPSGRAASAISPNRISREDKCSTRKRTP